MKPNWYFATWQSPFTGRWTAMAKSSPFVCGHPINEPGEIWFAMGDDEKVTMSELQAEVLRQNDPNVAQA